MKFDYLIGNPPYQDNTLGKNDSYAPPVYHLFMDANYELSDKAILVTPARFLFNAGSTPKAWNQKMLSDVHLKILHYEPNSSKMFNNTNINGGIVITYHNNIEEYKAIEVFTQYPELNSIRQKVMNYEGFKPFSSIVLSAYQYHFTELLYKDHPELKGRLSNGHDYDLKTNVMEVIPEVFHETKQNSSDIRILGRKNGERTTLWINSSYINSPIDLNKYKVFLAGADGAAGSVGKPIPARIIGTAVLGEKDIGHTESFLSIGAFDTIEEANNLLKYIKTRFARTLLSVLKVTQNITPEKWNFVPMQIFKNNSDINWNKDICEIDKQLYTKYGLSISEIEFIKTYVKEME